jgi:SHS2 domain-containing protein
MPYEYLDHEADIGVRGIGATPEEALAEGARAMLHVMVNPETVTPTAEIPVHCQADDLESLFVALLNELLYLREVKATTLVDLSVTRLEETGGGWMLEGVATGEPLDPGKHEFLTEVKAATYFGLKYYTEGGRHVFQCVVDV